MLIPCPACAAEYEVPDHLIGAGRRLRCARCEHEWLVRPPADAAAPDTAPPAPAPAPVVAKPAAPPATAPVPLAPPLPAAPPPAWKALLAGPDVALWLAWGCSVGAVFLVLLGGWLYRAELSAFWPPLARLYGG